MEFANTSPKSAKRHLGRTSATQTPIAVHSTIKLPDGFEQTVRERIAAQVGYAGTLFERGTVRFDDVNGPRGGTDTACRIQLVLSGRPSIHVEKRAATPGEAFAAAVHALKTVVERTTRKHGLRAGRARKAPAPTKPAVAKADEGELIGARAGRGPAALERALERPEKKRRDAYVDTSAANVSATARRAGGNSSARRNARARPDDAAVALEDSRTKPSRKSTRRSSAGGKPSHGKEQTVKSRATSPAATAQRAAARRPRT
jgi:hypothetical protein